MIQDPSWTKVTYTQEVVPVGSEVLYVEAGQTSRSQKVCRCQCKPEVPDDPIRCGQHRRAFRRQG